MSTPPPPHCHTPKNAATRNQRDFLAEKTDFSRKLSNRMCVDVCCVYILGRVELRQGRKECRSRSSAIRWGTSWHVGRSSVHCLKWQEREIRTAVLIKQQFWFISFTSKFFYKLRLRFICYSRFWVIYCLGKVFYASVAILILSIVGCLTSTTC